MKKKTVWDTIIRPCTPSDLKGINEISNLTWDGDDYLGRIAAEWINEGHFYIAEYKGKIVGTNKLTLFPNRVAWLEGLRVHPDFQKHGIGKQLSDFVMKEALNLRKQRRIRSIEFCTYYQNIESIAMAEKIGFKVVNELFVLSRSLTKRQIIPEKIEFPISLLKDYGSYLPCGWKSVHNNDEGRKWLREHIQGYRVGETCFYVGGYELVAVIPFLSEENLLEIMPALNYLFRDKKDIEILVSAKQADMIPMLKSHRFHFWSKPEIPNMLIYRWYPSHKGVGSRE